MRFLLWKCVTTLTIVLISCTQITSVHGSAVMSVDIGTEWMKVVTILSGEPIETINNEMVKKFPSAVAFTRKGRIFGPNALTEGLYNPSNCFAYFLDLIGKKIDNPVVDLYKKRFPHHEIVPHPERNTVLFKRNKSDELFSPEELVAMLLEEARTSAQRSSKQDINEVIISVPGYFGQAERSAMLNAAEMVGIKVLQLINSYTAAALNHGILHTESFSKSSPVYIMFYDMGAYSTQASIVSYQLVNSKGKRVPELTVVGVGYERNLGGLEIQLRLRDYLALRFNNLKLTPNDVTENSKAMAKLFQEAGKLRNALSTSTDYNVNILSLIDKKNMISKVVRGTLEELCEDLFDKVALPAQRALESSGLTIEHIEQVILIGGGIEIPRVQDRLVKDLNIGQALGRTFNTDEAAVVLGAAYKAADLSNGFEVKPFITKDATLFPIQVTFNEEKINDDKSAKQVTRILFNHMNPYPQHKIIKLNKRRQDFDLTVAYGELKHLDENEIKCLGSLSLKNIKLNSVQKIYSKYKGQESVIEAQFLMNDSGLLVLHSVELIVEKTDDEGILVSDSNGNLEIETIKETIDFKHEYLFVPPVQGDDLQSSINKLKELKKIDLYTARKEQSFHTLLAAMFEVQSRIQTPEYSSAATDTEKRTIARKCLGISTWLGHGTNSIKPEDFDEVFEDLKKLIMPVWTRTSEHLLRPGKLKALNNKLDNITSFLKEIKDNKLKDVPFEPLEMKKFEKTIFDIKTWRDQQTEAQEKLPKNVDPVLKVELIELVHATLDLQMNKFPSWKEKKDKDAQTDDEKTEIPEVLKDSLFEITLGTENLKLDEESTLQKLIDLEIKNKAEKSKPLDSVKTEKKDSKHAEKKDDKHTEKKDDKHTEKKDNNNTEKKDKKHTVKKDNNDTERKDKKQTEKKDNNDTEKKEDKKQTEKKDKKPTEKKDKKPTEKKDKKPTEKKDKNRTEL